MAGSDPLWFSSFVRIRRYINFHAFGGTGGDFIQDVGDGGISALRWISSTFLCLWLDLKLFRFRGRHPFDSFNRAGLGYRQGARQELAGCGWC